MSTPTVTIDDFIKIARVKESTIKRNKNRIPGLTYYKGKYNIIEGTRYPCPSLHKYKIKDSADKRYVLLKTISEYRYISHLDLGLYHPQFVKMLKELLDAGLIKPNNMANHYGANFYDCTRKGDLVIKKEKIKAVTEITNLVASSAGSFVGAVIAEVFV